jgi:hypothetical protein
MKYFVLGTDVTVSPPRLILMTTQAFNDRKLAEVYASNCNKAWGAFVVEGKQP